MESAGAPPTVNSGYAYVCFCTAALGFRITARVCEDLKTWRTEGSKLSSSSFEFEFELARTFCRWQVPKPSSYL